jgi:23S rRNA pseudouridine1911/1915/1917 synthase
MNTTITKDGAYWGRYIKILAETSDYLVINKPAGLITHSDGKHVEYSLADWVGEQYPETLDVGEPMVIEYEGQQIHIARPGIIHRLDRETSGVLMIAKNQEFFEHIKLQFQEHTVRKIYTAIVLGNPRDGRGLITAPIGRSARDIRMYACKGTRGPLRDAVTRYVVKKTYNDADHKFSYVDLYLETGRTHQLRVHMKHIGNPIIGDAVYARGTVGLLGSTRTMLHAHSIMFRDRSDREITVIAELSSDFKQILQVFA